MTIKRYIANKDNTISNAFKPNLILRGTGSNAGSADVMEVFSIYGQANSSSAELSRLLVEFPINLVAADRTDGSIPVSGSVTFKLNLYNAQHSFSVPDGMTLNVQAISGSAWEEGTGIDIDNYLDLTYDSSGSNWINAGKGVTWTSIGGDYYTDSSSSYTASFDTGVENLSLDITPLVEQWLNSAGNVLGSKENYGIGVMLTSSQEAHYSSSTGLDTTSIIHNPSGATVSYYTKKFFTRSSEYFFKRPNIEAQWDSSTEDDRGGFYLSSSLAPASDNLNTVYLYNYVRGQLKNIPGIGSTGSILVSFYSGSATNTAPSGSKLELSVGGSVTAASDYSATGGYVDVGIYSASVALTGSTSLTTLYDVWHSGTFVTPDAIQYHTGSISLKNFNSVVLNPNPEYVTRISNLRSEYFKNETARFRLHVREKDWNPTIYTKAISDIETEMIESAFYRLVRVIDNYVIIDYSTGSGDISYSKLSYDVSGNYFDLDMSMLEPKYLYGVKFVYHINNKYTEQPETFEFRVE